MDVFSSSRALAPCARAVARGMRCAGFTLGELLIAIGLLTVIMAGVVPAFRTLSANTRMSAAMNALVTHLHATRSEAVRNGRRAILCPTKNGRECARTNVWQHGWMIFPDPNLNNERDADEPILRQHGPLKGLTIRSGTYSYRVRYRDDGSSYFSNTTFTFCDNRGAAHARAVILSNPGRPRVSDEGPGGRDLEC